MMKVYSILLTVCILLVSSMSIAADPIKIGFVYILSGRLAGHGMVAKKGAELAIDETREPRWDSWGWCARELLFLCGDLKGSRVFSCEDCRKLATLCLLRFILGAHLEDWITDVIEILEQWPELPQYIERDSLSEAIYAVKASALNNDHVRFYSQRVLRSLEKGL